MAEIVDLDELVPDDIEFHYRGQTYLIPGDMESEQVLLLYKLLTELDKLATAEGGEDVKRLERQNRRVKQALLPIFQLRQPALKELPFGGLSLRIVIRQLLTQMGMIAIAEPEPADPPTAPAKKPAMRVPKKTPTRGRRGSSPGSRSS